MSLLDGESNSATFSTIFSSFQLASVPISTYQLSRRCVSGLECTSTLRSVCFLAERCIARDKMYAKSTEIAGHSLLLLVLVFLLPLYGFACLVCFILDLQLDVTPFPLFTSFLRTWHSLTSDNDFETVCVKPVGEFDCLANSDAVRYFNRHSHTLTKFNIGSDIIDSHPLEEG